MPHVFVPDSEFTVWRVHGDDVFTSFVAFALIETAFVSPVISSGVTAFRTERWWRDFVNYTLEFWRDFMVEL
jgi:hypothetical protein